MITILTPTYNRAYILGDLYQSLRRQTNKDFEWLIIDDGSSDDTERVIAQWKNENNDFVIRYYKQENGGKHRAWNYGVKCAKGEYIFVVDSDDYLLDNAIELILSWTKEIDSVSQIAGVIGMMIFKNGKSCTIHNKIITYLAMRRKKYIDISYSRSSKYGFVGDKAVIVKAEILRQYPFPEFDGEKFISEGAVFLPISKDGFIFRFYQENLYVCEYLQDGLTNNVYENIIKNWNGFLYTTKLRMETDGWFYRCKAMGKFTILGRKKGMTDKEIANVLNCSKLWLSFLTVPSKIFMKLKKRRV